MEESCQAAKEAAEAVPDNTACPCLSGGQWTFDGEKQSYCEQPNGLGKKPWCPTSESEVTSADMGTLSFAYCNNKKLKACQELEGTKLPTQCPCVEGGQFNYQGQSYSYCEETNWCATEVDESGNFIGKFAQCKKKKVKEACHQLHLLTTPEGQADLYGEFTQTSTGCPCWFDLTRDDCACCKNDGVQCGAPMQGWCAGREEGRQAGCLGVPSSHWTLSTTGFPCYWNTSSTNCAWCAAGGKILPVSCNNVNSDIIQVLSVDQDQTLDQTLPTAPDVKTRRKTIATPCLEAVSTSLVSVTVRPSVSSVSSSGRESTGSACATLQHGLAMVCSVTTVRATPVQRQPHLLETSN